MISSQSPEPQKASSSALSTVLSKITRNEKKRDKAQKLLESCMKNHLSEKTAPLFFDAMGQWFEDFKSRSASESYRKSSLSLLDALEPHGGVLVPSQQETLRLWNLFFREHSNLSSDDSFIFNAACKPFHAMVFSIDTLRSKEDWKSDPVEILRESVLLSVFESLHLQFSHPWSRVNVLAILEKATLMREFFTDAVSFKVIEWNADVKRKQSQPEKHARPWLKEDNKDPPHPVKQSRLLF